MGAAGASLPTTADAEEEAVEDGADGADEEEADGWAVE
jgi:hypothetical protein